MSISSEDLVAGPYDGDDTTVILPFGFKVFNTSQVLVVRTDELDVETVLTLGTDYTVSLNPNQDAAPGGSITLTAPAVTGHKTTLTSDIENLQPITLTNAGGFYPAVLNAALDRLTIMVQQVAEKAARSVKVPISSSVTPDSLIAQLTTDAATAATQAGVATTQAGIAATQAGIAATKAGEAAASALSIDPATLVKRDGSQVMTGPLTLSGDATDNLHAVPKQQLDATVAAIAALPVGMIFPYSGTTAPAGALALPTAPTNISRTTYAKLFAAIGTTWGVGDGATTFGMPYCPANQVPVQANANVGTSTVGQVIAHTHTSNAMITPPRHSTASIGGGAEGYQLSGTGASDSTGGAANLPAGVRVLYCVQYQ